MAHLSGERHTKALFELFDLRALATSEIRDYLQRVIEVLAQRLDVQNATLFLRESNPSIFHLRAATGTAITAPSNATIQFGEGIAGAAAKRGEAIILNDLEDHPNILGHAVQRNSTIVSSMILPLALDNQQPIGILNLARTSEPVFDEADLEEAQSVAAFATLAILNVEQREAISNHIRETARLKRLAEIGEFSAAIAHEIRNPLTGIKGAAQSIREGSPDPDKLLQIIEDEVDRLESLCGQFLDYGKPMELDLQPHLLAEIADHVANLISCEFEHKGVSLQVQQDSHITIRCDRPKIEQVLHNLLRNALQACERGDHVTLYAGDNTLMVEDTGCGIPSGQQATLFSPLCTTKQAGTGLGLSTVRKIAEAHGAEVTCSSISGHGTTFTVTFGGRM